MSIILEPSIFDGPPRIPPEVKGVLKYRLTSTAYWKKLKNVTWIFLELIGALFVIGLLYINVDWVKAIITTLAIGFSIILLLILRRILT